jgi:dCMP deaminase
MRPSRDEWAISLARQTSLRATCVRRQVGCVLLNARGHVLATGYNGVASGLPHCNEAHFQVGQHENGHCFVTRPEYPFACKGADLPSGTGLDSCQAIHAEQNALLQCHDVYQIHTAYITTSPCVTCVKLLLNTSCERIVFVEPYPHSESEKLWVAAGRKWETWP